MEVAESDTDGCLSRLLFPGCTGLGGGSDVDDRDARGRRELGESRAGGAQLAWTELRGGRRAGCGDRSGRRDRDRKRPLG